MAGAKVYTGAMKKLTGFSLIELLITLAIGGVVLTFAAPEMKGMVKGNRLTTQANTFVTALNHARSEAATRGRSVVLTSAGGNDWAQGWRLTEGAITIRTYPAAEQRVTMTGPASPITFSPSGIISPVGPLTFPVCDDRAKETGRLITLSTTGRVSVDPQFAGCS